MYSIEIDAHFDAAHFLTNYEGKCENLHGHRYQVKATLAKVDSALEIAAATEIADEEAGMVMDFSAAKKAVRDICASFDHTFLVEKGSLKPQTIEALRGEGFSIFELPFRTTAENLAHELYKRLQAAHLPVIKVEVAETPHNRATYDERD